MNEVEYSNNRVFLVEERLNKHPNLILNDTELSTILIGYYNPRLIKNLIANGHINQLWLEQWKVRGSNKKYPIDLVIDIYRKWILGEIELSIEPIKTSSKKKFLLVQREFRYSTKDLGIY